MKITIMTGLFAEWDVDVNSCHVGFKLTSILTMQPIDLVLRDDKSLPNRMVGVVRGNFGIMSNA
jgi:hypothetical protein